MPTKTKTTKPRNSNRKPATAGPVGIISPGWPATATSPARPPMFIPGYDARKEAVTAKLLGRPNVPELANIPLYDGPNEPGIVNLLITCAQRIAKGAIDDGFAGVFAIADERRAKANEAARAAEDAEFAAVVARLDPAAVKSLLVRARSLAAAKS